MRLDKVIVRAILSTLAAMLALFAFMILALTFIYPSTMMEITYNLGMDGASLRCAARAYDYTDNVYYIAYATEVAIGAEDYAEIVECGSKLIHDDEERFQAYCEVRNATLPDGATGTYEQYVYGQVCAAKYRLGEKQAAVEEAFGYLEPSTFPQNNPAAAVLLVALEQEGKSGETVAMIKEKMNGIANISDEDKAYFDGIFALLNG